MRRILIVPVLLIMAVVRIVFHVAELILYLPFAVVKAVADGAGSILKTLVKGEQRYGKAKQAIGETTPVVDSGEQRTAESN